MSISFSLINFADYYFFVLLGAVHHSVKLSHLLIKLLRRTHLQNLSLRKHDNFVEVGDCLESVCHCDYRRIMKPLSYQCLHNLVSLQIDVRSSLVQNQVSPILENGPSQANQLLFANTEAFEDFAHLRV